MTTLKRLWDLIVLTAVRILLIILISLKSLFTRQRMSHQNGIVATGHLQIVDNPKLPKNKMFVPGKKFDCRLRHATVRFMDDAGLIPRSASLKFADSDDRSPLDLLMNTGSASPFYNMVTFWQFMKTSIGGGRVKSIEFLKKNQRCFVNFRRAVRRNPETFAQLYYHTQTIFEFCALDEKKRYIRFRLIPEDRGPETGIPTPEDLETVWFQQARPDETRTCNYLKDEFRERVTKNGGVTYHLQSQVHNWQSDDRRDVILNSVYEWDETIHPWLDVATVKLDGILAKDDRRNAPIYSVERGDHCLFTLANRPDCIKLIKAESIHDPASLDYLRAAGTWARRVRLFATKVFGPLKPIPDERSKEFYDDESLSTVRADDVYTAAILPQDENSEERRERRQQLEVARGKYQHWGTRASPRHVKAMPEVEAFTSNRIHRMDIDLIATIADLGLAAVEKELCDDEGLAHYDHLFPLIAKPSVSERFKKDEEFGRQRLNGVNPFVIRRCQKMPDKKRFPVDGKIIADLLDHDSLTAAIEAGRVYELDYAKLSTIKPREGRYLTAPMVLLYVNDSKKLIPLAIQLGQSPDDGPVFTPHDEFWLWQTVKTFVQSADGQHQEAISHLLRMHLVLETMAISIHRQLSIAHPVHKLLAPHFRFNMAINNAARNGLLAHDGPIDTVFSMGVDGSLQLISNAWTDPDWSFDIYNVDYDLKSRGVDDEELLPNFHYRDDARLLWSAINNFVSDTVGHFYKTDEDLSADFELQNWLDELTDPEDGNIKGFPDKLDGIDDLVKLLTTIIFTASAGHSSTNNGQYDMYGFIPNVPGAMFGPPPTSKEPMSEKELAALLPKGKAAAQQIATAHLLSEPTESPLGDYHPSFFAAHREVHKFVRAFQKELRSISRQIEARNAEIDVPYVYLDPKLIAVSVDI